MQLLAFGILSCVLMFLPLRAGAALYYVATNGSDANPGTNIDAPFRTLQHAAASVFPADTCYIRGGVYRETLTPARSGTSNEPIVFSAYGGELVTISAADVVTGWQTCPGGVYSAPVNWDLGNGYNQAFVDGAMLHQARFPHFGGGGLFHPATVAVTVGGSQGTVITSSALGGRPDNFWAGAWFSGAIDVRWSWQSARITSSCGNSITVDPATRSNPWFAGNGCGFVWGIQSLLDGDNEWNLSRQSPTSLLSVRLAGGASPSSHTLELKRRTWCINLAGQSHVTIQGLRLLGGAVWLKGNHNILEKCQARFLSHYMTYAWGYSFDGGCRQGGGIVIDGTNNIVNGCTISDTAGSGIISSGSDNVITRNLIYNTDYSGTYACGIRLAGLRDRVSNNTVHTSGRDILQPGGAGHSICFNDFSCPGQMCLDCGVLYIWGVNAQVANGSSTRIAYNWFHDNNGPGATPLIYLDNWCRNFVVDHNVCWNSTGDSGLRINAPASGHLIYNNTLFCCEDLGTHTYDAWPDNNPDPAFWTCDRNQYSSANNLYLGANPQSQLADWARHDFRLKAGSFAINSGVCIPGYTDFFPLVGAPDKGACEYGSSVWKAGVDGWCQPNLKVASTAPGTLKLTAPPGAAYFQLQTATNSRPPIVWTPVTNAPSVSRTEWMLTLQVAPGEPRLFRLQAK